MLMLDKEHSELDILKMKNATAKPTHSHNRHTACACENTTKSKNTQPVIFYIKNLKFILLQMFNYITP